MQQKGLEVGLKEYQSKRHLSKSGEPKAGKATKPSSLNFVIQRHAASHLHYDLRLELEGVLKSWAVPKEPSLDPSIRRLAIQVEDHPLDYQYFEGTIPKGNYGAGEVTIWDHGTYEPLKPSVGNPQALLKKELKEGALKFILHGEKLKGAYTLVKLKNRPDNQWLLIKKKDAMAFDKQSTPMPHWIKPMLGTLVDAPFNRSGWLFEVKWDGFRAISEIAPPKVNCYSRNFESFKSRFPLIVNELKTFKEDMILDGEIVVLDEKGISHFQLLQNYLRHPEGNLKYLVFDLLYYRGQDLCNLPLRERRALLEQILSDAKLNYIQYSEGIEERGKALFEKAIQHGLEGIMAKDLGSSYSSARAKTWLKIKCLQRQEFVIGGFTPPLGSRKYFGALMVGVYKGKHLTYVGNVGGGFNQQSLKDLYEKLMPLVQAECPFEPPLRVGKKPVHWVKPQWLCEVSFQEWTDTGQLRQPIFHGVRMDKKSKEVVRENPQSAQAIVEKEALTHPDKVFWPKEGYTKGDLFDYYRSIAKFILPYLKDRPQVLHRFPNGIAESSFYQKEAPKETPKEVKRITIEHTDHPISYILIQNLNSLLYAVNLGCIEIHPFLSRYQQLDKPDYLVIDLDPEHISFKKVVETALILHELLESAAIPHYCKTSGATGLHIYIPLHALYTFEQIHDFSQLLATITHQHLPQVTSIVRSPSKRSGKVYVDYLQNRFGQSVVAPYSVRPRPNAPVSTPLKWEEVNEALDPLSFTIKTLLKRVEKVGDLFKPVLGRGINLSRSLKKLEPLI